MLALLCVLGLSLLLIAYQGYQARGELQAASRAMVQVSDLVKDGDAAAARKPLAAAQGHSARAAKHTSGPVWWIGTKVPFVGDDLAAVATVAEVARALSQGALPPAVSAGQELSPELMTPRNGRFDFTAVHRAAPKLLAADEVVRVQSARMAEIDLSRLFGPVRRQVSAVSLQLNEVSAASATAARVAKVGPWLFDGTKPRRLLVAFNNNAEIRATGGMPGALGVLTFNKGKVTFGEQRAPRDIGVQQRPAGPLTDAERTIWSDRLAYLPQDTNFTPDYPRGAALLETMWERKFRKVDGVLSVDPIAMSYLLKGADPLPVAGYQITGANTVQVLLNQIYLDVRDPERQNDIFADVAAATFSLLASGRVDNKQAYQGLQRGIEERRILLYLDDPEMQQELAGSRIAGDLDFGSGPNPHVSLSFNDGTSTKMDYYLRYVTSVESVSCQGDRQTLRVTSRMTSQVPKDLDQLTPSILGPARAAPKGVLVTAADLIGPVGGSIDSFEVDGVPPVYVQATLGGREIASTRVFLKPGQTATLSYTVTTGKGQIGDPALRVTPGVADLGLGEIGKSSCG